MELAKESALIETILFLESEPVTEASMATVSGLTEEVVAKCIEVLKEKYKDESAGMELDFITGGWALVPKKDNWEVLKERYGNTFYSMLSEFVKVKLLGEDGRKQAFRNKKALEFLK